MASPEKRTIADYIIVALLSLWGLIIFYPFYNALIVSFIPPSVYIRYPFLLFPLEPNLLAYRTVFSSNSIVSGYLVTLYCVVFGTVYNMLLTVCVSFAFTHKFPGRRFFFILIVITMFFGGGIIPTYLLIRSLGMLNNLIVYIIPTGFSVFFMFILRSYMQDLPPSLEESAKMDGANELIILFRIILPMCLPILATLTLFYAVGHWNQYFAGLIYVRDIGKRPLQLVLRSIIVGLERIQDQNMPVELRMKVFGEGVKMAAVFVTMAPIMLFYPFLQRYFMKGIAIGAVKG